MLTLRMDGWLKVLKGITHARAGHPRDRGVIHRTTGAAVFLRPQLARHQSLGSAAVRSR